MTARRLADIPPTVFSEMSALALRTGALNLGQGFPDVDGPPSVIAAAVEALGSGANQYAPGIGVPALRQAIARHQQRNYGLEVDPDREVVVTTGATEAIAAALLGLVDPGDEVVVLEPYYDSYVAMLTMCGAVRRPVTLRAPDFRPDLDELRAAITPLTRLVLLNTPHNPTGTVLTREELQVGHDLAIEHDVVVVTDEVYEHLVFDDARSAEGHRGRADATRARGHLLRHDGRLAPRLGRRTRALPGPPRTRRRGRDPHAGVLRRRRGRAPAGALGLLQGARRHPRGRTTTRRRRPRPLSAAR